MKIMKPALKVAILGFFSVFQVNGFVGPLQRTSLTCETPSIGRTPIEFVLKPQGFEFALSAETSGGEKSKLPFFLDPGTKGGAVFLSLVLFIIPIIIYNIVVSVFGVDEIEAGKWIGIGFTVLATLGWVSTYLFRVATKDMTYVRAANNTSERYSLFL